MNTEIRSAAITSRDVGDHPHGGMIARAVRYGPPADDYGTTWAPGFANEALRSWLPVLAFGHDWLEPIGRCVRWWEEGDGLYMEFAFDDPDDVPRARQIRSQVRSGTLRSVSIGFTRLADEPNRDGTTNITKAEITECSVVLKGAVPGADVLAARHTPRPMTKIERVVAQIRSGTRTAPPASSPPVRAALAELDAALAAVGRIPQVAAAIARGRQQ